MPILFEILAVSIIILVVFSKRRRFDVKMRHLKLAILFFILIQLAIFLTGIVLFAIFESVIGKEGQINFGAALVWLAILGSLILSLILSARSIRRKLQAEKAN